MMKFFNSIFYYLFIPVSLCVVCKQQYDGGHSCISCKNPCHTFCGEPVSEEGFGKPVLCFNCKDMSMLNSTLEN